MAFVLPQNKFCSIVPWRVKRQLLKQRLGRSIVHAELAKGYCCGKAMGRVNVKKQKLDNFRLFIYFHYFQGF